MGDDGGRSVIGKPLQRRPCPGAEIGKTFALRRAMAGQRLGAERPEIGQIAMGQPVPRAEILLPKVRFGHLRQPRPQCGGGLATAQRRADRQPRRTTGCLCDGGNRRRIGQIGRHVGSPAQPPACQRWRMTDQDQLCRAFPIHRRIPPFVARLFLLCHHAMSKTILITGGARSGKSVIAETKALSMGRPCVYIATAEARDPEMVARIAAHRARRGPEWIDHAAPLDLRGALGATDGRGPRLVDCLTLWLTNLMLGGHDWATAARDMCTLLPRQTDPVVLVTNEVGAGIVPDNKLARDFRDAAGLLNQMVAAVADEVILAVAGLPLKVK